MVDLSLRSVTDTAAIRALAELAQEIWTEHFPPIIGAKQTACMIQTFQSVEAITRQIREDGYQYSLLCCDSDPVGYFAVRPEPEKHAMFLSKIYIQKNFRGRGFSRVSLDTITNRCRKAGLTTLYLTVNKCNFSSIAVYEKLGFVRARDLVTEIREEFVMDDYVMEKYL